MDTHAREIIVTEFRNAAAALAAALDSIENGVKIMHEQKSKHRFSMNNRNNLEALAVVKSQCENTAIIFEELATTF